MDTIARRAFLGVAGLGAVAAAAAAEGADETTEYGRLARPIVVGLGRGQAASLTFVWLPRDPQRPSLKARLAIFDLGGKVLAQSDVVLAPFTGASVEFELPSKMRRAQVFGYVFVDDFQQLAGEVFGGVEVFDTSSGQTNIFAAPTTIA
jgi:hypothetical protein